MMGIFWLLLSFALIDFVVVTAFLVVVTGKRLRDEARWMPAGVRGIIWFWFGAGSPADVLFNTFRGSIIFREWPWDSWKRGELTFSQRVEHWYRLAVRYRKTTPPSPPGYAPRMVLRAENWASFLNVDPGHIDEPEA